MITLGDQINRTPLTYIILLAYVSLAFVTGLVTADGEKLMAYGAATGERVASGEFWCLLTYAFLHGGLLHLAFNSYFLIILGPSLEQELGSPRFGLLYVVGAVGGGVGGCLWHHPGVPLVGGSGALFGMMGAALALNMRRGRHLLEFMNQSGPRQLVTLIVANLVLGLLIPFVSNAAHVGGLIAGFALAFCFLTPRREPIDPTGRLIQGGWIALFAALIFYCLHPVLRTDYLVRRFERALQTSNEVDLRAYAEVLVRRDHLDYIRPEQRVPWMREVRRWAGG